MGILSEKGVIYKAVKEVDVGPNSHELYLHANVKAPRLAGIIVKIFVWFLESRIFGPLLLYALKRNNLIHKLVRDAEFQEAPAFAPEHVFADNNGDEVVEIRGELGPQERVQCALVDCVDITCSSSLPPADNKLVFNTKKPLFSFHRWTVIDYSNAYASGALTPTTVAERFIAAVTESSGSPLHMSFFINCNADDVLRQAAQSTLRYQRGEAISVLDGVPIAIKDEIDCLPYPTTGGTKWLPKYRPCKQDACCVARLRLCGAILVGKTNMHELGAGTSGINPHYGTARNPYDIRRISGGSSSGSAAVVAAGLCPVALGVDGGGSVRMPAALCGVIGFKPTFARIPHQGVLPLNWTVGMVGILAGTVEDALITYAAISGDHAPQGPTTSSHPKLYYPILKSKEALTGIKLAKYGKWFNDSTEDIKLTCSKAIDRLCGNFGCKVVDVTIPEIEAMRLAHYVTIGSECTTSLSPFLENLDMSESGWDVRVALSVYGAFSAKDYIQAQRMRNRQMQFHMNIFENADVIVSPTTGVTAYLIKDDTRETGELDYVNGAALVRYSIAGNFLGLPAITVPVGYDKLGLPIGLQLIGRPWSEPTLIHIASAMQELCTAEYRKPEVFYDLLSK